jgi:hypothetical protein
MRAHKLVAPLPIDDSSDFGIDWRWLSINFVQGFIALFSNAGYIERVFSNSQCAGVAGLTAAARIKDTLVEHDGVFFRVGPRDTCGEFSEIAVILI